ncbi:CAP domain-containing protein [Strongyloides ratti]|uniref:CAP domain-containing protein n=1 Tax=Strongyloides ratti TaxID=34506 RepID=A0A090LR48_STRRB|nr:CAP domain-containing protein [Strongyloides ratti]CEF70647.2 CAP domain-containing protein [Strongyloides ratti]
MKYYLNIHLFTTIILSLTNAQTGKNFLECIKISRTNCNLNDHLKTMSYYLIHNKIVYQVNEYVFFKHSEALKYYNIINSNSSYKKIFKPRGAVRPSQIYAYEKKQKIAEYNYNDVLSNNPFTSKIYKMVWYGCDYQCYSMNNYQLLKQGIFTEMNLYRKLHNEQPLISIHFYNELANMFAKRNAKNVKETHIILYSYSYVSGIIHRTVATKFLKRLFDLFYSYYDFNNNNYQFAFAKQTQILWNSTTKVGVGAVECNELVYIVILFQPKGNINKKYRKNVFRVSDKQIHLYNLFKKRVGKRVSF